MAATKTKKKAEAETPRIPAPEILAWTCYHQGKQGCGGPAFLFLLDRLPQPGELVDPKLYRDIHGVAVPENAPVTCGTCGIGDGESAHQFVVDVLCGNNPMKHWVPFVTREEASVRRYKALALLGRRLDAIEREMGV